MNNIKKYIKSDLLEDMQKEIVEKISEWKKEPYKYFSDEFNNLYRYVNNLHYLINIIKDPNYNCHTQLSLHYFLYGNNENNIPPYGKIVEESESS